MKSSTLTMVVVDDDLDRELVYSRFFDVFNASACSDVAVKMLFCGSAAAADKAVRTIREPFIVLLDMVLSGWPPDLCQQLEAQIASLNIGVMAISGRFSDIGATSSYLRVLRLLGNRYLPIIHWSSVIAVVEEERAREEAQEAVQSLMVRNALESLAIDIRTLRQWDTLGERTPNSRIVLMHLSDLHFGVETATRQQHLFQIGARLRAEDLTVDFVCVSGDSINRGHSGGYEPALEWLNGLRENGCLNIGPGSPAFLRERIFVCPGNHDFNEGLAVSAYVRRKSGAPSGFELVADTATKPIDDTWTYGIAPFLRYHESLTGWRVGHGEFPGYRIASGYAFAGVHFMELWAEEYRCGDYPSPVPIDWFRKKLAQAVLAIGRAASDGDCVVVLVHRFTLGADALHSKEIRQTLGALAPRLRVVVLCGHFHDDEVTVVPGQPGMLRVQGGSIDEKTRPEDQLAKIGIVTLRRTGGMVDCCKVQRLERRASGWHLAREVDVLAWEAERWIDKPPLPVPSKA